MIIKRFFKWFFATPEEPRSWLKVIWWWEARRIPYNLVVGVVGVVSLVFYFLFIYLSRVELRPGEDVIEPLALIAAPFVINICYTLGWVAELFLQVVWREKSPILGPVFLKLGLSFTLTIELLPSVAWCLVWIVQSMYKLF